MLYRAIYISACFSFISFQQAMAQPQSFELLKTLNASATEGAAIFSTSPVKSGESRRLTLLLVLKSPQADTTISYVETPVVIDCKNGVYRYIAKPTAFDSDNKPIEEDGPPPDFDLATSRPIDTSDADASAPVPAAFQYACRGKAPLKRFDSLAGALSFERAPNSSDPQPSTGRRSTW